MVCPKLSSGMCRVTKKVCAQPYEIKMINHKACRVYKKGSAKTKKKAGKRRR